MIDDVIEVLRICQEGEDARAALVEVARLVQARTRADAVVFVAAARRPLLVAWPSAGRPHVHAASRALETGAALAPARGDDGTEAAHPVRCAGSVIGAVGCRWSGPPPSTRRGRRRCSPASPRPWRPPSACCSITPMLQHCRASKPNCWA